MPDIVDIGFGSNAGFDLAKRENGGVDPHGSCEHQILFSARVKLNFVANVVTHPDGVGDKILIPVFPVFAHWRSKIFTQKWLVIVVEIIAQGVTAYKLRHKIGVGNTHALHPCFADVFAIALGGLAVIKRRHRLRYKHGQELVSIVVDKGIKASHGLGNAPEQRVSAHFVGYVTEGNFGFCVRVMFVGVDAAPVILGHVLPELP